MEENGKLPNEGKSAPRFPLKKWGSNVLFLVVVTVLLFTEVGKDASVFVKRIFLMQPEIEGTTEIARLDASGYNWVVSDLEGNTHSFTEFKGKVVFLNFWATWCPPCRAELPSIQELYEQYGDRVAFLLVSSESNEAVSSFVAKKGYDFPVYTVAGGVPGLLYSQSIPATYIINKNGGLVLVKRGAVAWDGDKTTSLIDNLLQEPIAER